MHFVSEENPVLGNRSIRYLLRNSDIFFTQLRAMLKAQAKTKGNLKILIPMVTIYEEVSRIRDHIQKVIRDLKFEGYVLKRPPLGVMIEVPAAINLIPKFSSVVDFFCIGTNDLLQYFFAADRTNSQVQYLCRWHNPAFMGTLKGILNSSKELNKSVSVCGEMSGELWGGLVLVGLGYRKLSMDKALTYRHHELFSAVNTSHFSRLCKKLIQCNTSLEVLELLQLFLDEWPSLSEDLKELLQSELNNLINPS
jgi:phosphoenolpyruvate-protein kinase (PTS system EI component)